MIYDFELKCLIKENIQLFHLDLLKKSKSNNKYYIEIDDLISRKDPYKLIVNNFTNTKNLVKCLLDEHIRDSLETKFGSLYENIVAFILDKNFSGERSKIQGIDFEFIKDKHYYLLQLKSSNNWGNSSQKKQLKENFFNAHPENNKNNLPIKYLNGCCSGKINSEYEYITLSGQMFWEFITNDCNFYLNLAKLIFLISKEFDFQNSELYLKLLDKLTNDFNNKFYNYNNMIGEEYYFDKILQFNSGLLNS